MSNYINKLGISDIELTRYTRFNSKYHIVQPQIAIAINNDASNAIYSITSDQANINVDNTDLWYNGRRLVPFDISNGSLIPILGYNLDMSGGDIINVNEIDMSGADCLLKDVKRIDMSGGAIINYTKQMNMTNGSITDVSYIKMENYELFNTYIDMSNNPILDVSYIGMNVFEKTADFSSNSLNIRQDASGYYAYYGNNLISGGGDASSNFLTYVDVTTGYTLPDSLFSSETKFEFIKQAGSDNGTLVKANYFYGDAVYATKFINTAEGGILGNFADFAGNKVAELAKLAGGSLGGLVSGFASQVAGAYGSRFVNGFQSGLNKTLNKEKEFFNDNVLSEYVNDLVGCYADNYLGVINRYNPDPSLNPTETFIVPQRVCQAGQNVYDYNASTDSAYKWYVYGVEDSHSDQYSIKLKSYSSITDFSNNAKIKRYAFGVATSVGDTNRLYNIDGDLYFNGKQYIFQDGDQIRIANSTLTNTGLEAYQNELYWNGKAIGLVSGDWLFNNVSKNLYAVSGIEVNTGGGLSSTTNDCLDVYGGNINDKYISRFVNTRLYLQSSASWGSNDIGGIQLDNLRPADYTSVKTIYRYNDNLWWGTEQLNNQVNKYINVSGTTTTPNSKTADSAFVVYTNDDAKARLCLMTDQDGGSNNSALITKTYGGSLSFTNQSSTATTDLDHLTISTTGAVAINKTLTIYNNNNETTSFQLVGGGIQLQKSTYNLLISNDANGIATFTGNASDAERTFYINTRGSGYNTNVFSFGEAIGTHSQNFTVAGSSYFGGSLTANNGISTTSILASGGIEAGTYLTTKNGDIRLYDGTTSIASIATYANVSRAGEYKLFMGQQGSTIYGLSLVVKAQTSGTSYLGFASLNTEIDTGSTFAIKGRDLSVLKLINSSNDAKYVDIQIDSNGYFNQYSTGNYYYNRSDNGIFCGAYPSSTAGSLFYLTTSTTSDNVAKFEISSTAKTRLQLTYNGGTARTYLLTNDGTNILEDLNTSGMSYYLRRHNNTSVINRYALTADHEWLDNANTPVRLFYLESSSRTAFVGSSSTYISVKHDGTNGTINCNTGLLYLAQGGTNLVSLTSSGSLMTVPRLQVYGNNSADAFYIQGFGYGAGYGIYLNATTNATTNGMVWITFRTDDTERGYIYYANPANTTVYSTTSDYRLKEEITDIDEDKTVARMEKLRTRHYKWKETGAYMRGFIAHELAEDGFDYAVSYEKDAVDASGNPQYQGIDTSLLVADICCVSKYLIKNVKQLKTEHQALTDTFAQHTIKITEVQDAIKQISDKLALPNETTIQTDYFIRDDEGNLINAFKSPLCEFKVGKGKVWCVMRTNENITRGIYITSFKAGYGITQLEAGHFNYSYAKVIKNYGFNDVNETINIDGINYRKVLVDVLFLQ